VAPHNLNVRSIVVPDDNIISFAIESRTDQIICALDSRREIVSKNVQLGLPEVPLDENRIVQVITNLLNNALKFTPEGGKISLKVCESPKRPEYVQVQISDTGRGIPKHQLDRIFDRLYQVKLGDAATEKGIGLGLYICRELVDLHGGQIWVESEMGKGSTFTFELPKDAGQQAPTVLVIDDDPAILKSLRYALQQAAFKVITAEGGDQALQLMHRQGPDVVLIDLDMPGMDGAEALKEIRSKWGPVPAVVHTGYPNGELMMRALDCSPFTVLAKPCPEKQLVDTVRMVQRQSDTCFWRKNRRISEAALLKEEKK